MGSLAVALQVGPVTAAAMVAEHGNAILDIMDSPKAVDMLQRWVTGCRRDEPHWGEKQSWKANAVETLRDFCCTVLMPACLLSLLCSLSEPAQTTP